jgi:hypothetical protein
MVMTVPPLMFSTAPFGGSLFLTILYRLLRSLRECPHHSMATSGILHLSALAIDFTYRIGLVGICAGLFGSIGYGLERFIRFPYQRWF